MNREALGPVVVVVVAITLATAVVVGTLQEAADAGDRAVTAIDNGGLAVMLVAVFFLFDSTDYAGYRALGGPRILLDGAYVFVVAAVVTAAAATGLEVIGLESLPATLGPLSVDGVEVAVSVPSLFSGLYGFFLRNRRFFDTPASAEQSSNPA
ncbi:hypothetical protein BRC87_06945 [Halobacteriales archaeon QS_4_66_20]|nr:MAG: hypothetical protein BRC87_06945 [Halobacteriales archaeon QS_4_66_20]